MLRYPQTGWATDGYISCATYGLAFKVVGSDEIESKKDRATRQPRIFQRRLSFQTKALENSQLLIAMGSIHRVKVPDEHRDGKSEGSYNHWRGTCGSDCCIRASGKNGHQTYSRRKKRVHWRNFQDSKL